MSLWLLSRRPNEGAANVFLPSVGCFNHMVVPSKRVPPRYAMVHAPRFNEWLLTG